MIYNPRVKKGERLSGSWVGIGNAQSEEIDHPVTNSTKGKRLRAELLVSLRDLAGLKFREIAELPVFSDLHYLSLAHIYQNHKRRKENEYTD